MTTASALFDAGAHFVELQGKKPQHRNWRLTPLDRESVLAADENHLGVVPASLGLVVIDVDVHDGEKPRVQCVVEKLGEPLSRCDTPSGGVHLFYRKPDAQVGNKKWRYGDVRGDKGFVVLYSKDAVLTAYGAASAASAPDLSQLPKPEKKNGKPKPGNRNNSLNTEAFNFARRGELTDEKQRELAKKYRALGLDYDEIRDTIASALAAGSQSPQFARKDAKALKRALELLGIDYRYNTRAHLSELRKSGGEWELSTDQMVADIVVTIAERFSYTTTRNSSPLHYGRDAWRENFDALLYHRHVDPFRQWLEGLPEWDGEKRLDNYLIEFFSVSRDPLSQWVSRFLLLGAVQRAYQPGAALDEMPVLYGAQGIGKSKLLRSLLPPERDEWFCDSLRLSSDAKTRAETLQGRVIVEVAEMTGATRADLESLKTFISQQNDGTVRFAYRRNPETMLRQCILVGTSNNELMLPNDPTGLRRFVPVKLNAAKRAVEPYMDEVRSQLWAEALACYRKGERAGLPYELRPAAAEVAERHRSRDDILEDLIAGLPEKFEGGALLWEIGEHCGFDHPISARDSLRLGAALRNLGWVCRQLRVDGQKQRRWVKV